MVVVWVPVCRRVWLWCGGGDETAAFRFAFVSFFSIFLAENNHGWDEDRDAAATLR